MSGNECHLYSAESIYIELGPLWHERRMSVARSVLFSLRF
jgi:hypothetical protein